MKKATFEEALENLRETAQRIRATSHPPRDLVAKLVQRGRVVVIQVGDVRAH